MTCLFPKGPWAAAENREADVLGSLFRSPGPQPCSIRHLTNDGDVMAMSTAQNRTREWEVNLRSQRCGDQGGCGCHLSSKAEQGPEFGLLSTEQEPQLCLQGGGRRSRGV